MFPKGPSLPRLAALLSLLCIALIPATAASQSRRYLEDERLLERASWPAAALKALGTVRAGESADEAASNILSFYVTEETGRLALRVGMVQMQSPVDSRDHFARQRVRVLVLMDTRPGGRTDLPEGIEGSSPIEWDSYVELDPAFGGGPASMRGVAGEALEVLPGALARVDSRRDVLSASFELPASLAGRVNPRPQLRGASAPVRYFVISVVGGQIRDRLLAPLGTPVYEANVDFVNHGNQGLAYSDVFHGRSGAESTSGFDDILAMHQNAGVPGNFHVGGLIQTSAQWNYNNGDPYDFNGTLRAGVTAGWAAILTSAYSQHIMPFATDGMNNWSIDREKAMVTYRYNYNARVAWVPERVWLSPTQGPTGGVVDWMGDNFTNHGVDAVILDDNIHGQGYDNHQIHTMAGTGLRVILRDNNFTGKMHAGDGAGALAVLTGLASSGLGTYRLVTYADDWEMAAAMGNWATDMPYAYGTYQYMITKCQTESAWLHAWKLDPALDNPNFNGSPAMNVTYGTYGSIGGTAGYGGSNNAWYTDWAAFVPYVTGGNGSGACDVSRGGNCMNHGSIWNTTQAKLSLAPVNNISESGWYVMMSNLHEEGWHDYLGGPISGWQRNYSAHIKNAKIYAEAARWAGGLYGSATGAYLSDIDEDGFNELVMYNDRVFAVFETAGGRATQIFAKGPAGQNFSIVGSDNAYWSGTEGDFNDANHIAAFSDVGPGYQNDPYNVHVDIGTGNTVQATFDHYGVTKTLKLTLGQPYIDALYSTGGQTQYIQSGWTPDLVDVIYNAQMSRVFVPSRSYVGERNPNTGATGAYVLGSGGATFNKQVTGTVVQGDEIYGSQSFEFYIYAGYASAPDGSGHIAELDSLAAHLTDQIPPQVATATYFPVPRQLSITFTEAVRRSPVVFTGIALDQNNDGVADVTLDNSTVVTNPTDAATLVLTVSPSVGAAISALNHTTLRLLMAAGAAQDVHSNLIAQVRNTDNKLISFGAPTSITIDGFVNMGEWTQCAVAVRDSNDSQWNSGPGLHNNEIQALLMSMDSTYLYLAIAGRVDHNSWLMYLDTDPGGSNGQADLRGIDTWNRKTLFTAPGFKADWEYGCFQDQGAFDSNGLWKILSPTTTADSSSRVLLAFDSNHVYGDNGGSELAIPWSVLYGVGAGRVPANARISIVASLAYNGASGQLGGDVAPNPVAAMALPTIDKVYTFTVDANGDGYPDLPDHVAPVLASASAPNDTTVIVTFSKVVEPVSAGTASNYAIYRTSTPAQTVTVKSAVRIGAGTQVTLTTAHQIYQDYTLMVSAVRDTACNPNTIASNSSVAFAGSPVAVEEPRNPGVLTLMQNAPNPFGRLTVIRYYVPASGAGGALNLSVFDSGGRRIRTLAQGASRSGAGFAEWDGRDESGARAGAGVYYYRLSSGAEKVIRKMVLLR